MHKFAQFTKGCFCFAASVLVGLEGLHKVHKKRSVYRAGEAGEQARAKGVRQGVISSAIRRLSGAHVDG